MSPKHSLHSITECSVKTSHVEECQPSHASLPQLHCAILWSCTPKLSGQSSLQLARTASASAIIKQTVCMLLRQSQDHLAVQSQMLLQVLRHTIACKLVSKPFRAHWLSSLSTTMHLTTACSSRCSRCSQRCRQPSRSGMRHWLACMRCKHAMRRQSAACTLACHRSAVFLQCILAP